MSDYEWTCPGCKRTFHEMLDNMRDWSGTFEIPGDNDGTKEVDLLCDDCHREFVRE
ncbi:hypothetical protein [Natrinema salaciae]|uniref:Adenylate kinase, active site lid n=1 Tax=Natrinema salaciae TaxID=1186196 RepID=A0A1H9EVX3_9EURY|nr:hypothetical protein [Natrinema salaciae]SEQ29805.1 Adenylate kinase, active site lid [Natrinema salaciae]